MSKITSACNFHRYCLCAAVPVCLPTSLFPHDLISILPNIWMGRILDFLIVNEGIIFLYYSESFVFLCQPSVHLPALFLLD